jgi:hypothetical protein
MLLSAEDQPLAIVALNGRLTEKTLPVTPREHVFACNRLGGLLVAEDVA